MMRRIFSMSSKSCSRWYPASFTSISHLIWSGDFTRLSAMAEIDKDGDDVLLRQDFGFSRKELEIVEYQSNE